MGRLVAILPVVLCFFSLTSCLLSTTRAAALRANDLRRALEQQAMQYGRLLADATAPGGAVVPLYWSRELFNVANFSIGTPPQPASAFIDVGGLLVWTQCKQCSSCFKQELPLFDPTKSSTYRPEPCGTPLCEFFPTSIRNCSGDVCAYKATTQLFKHTFGKIGTDAVAVGTATPASIAFGCVVASDIDTMGGPSGYVGLARTPLSLVTQMNATVFSHCLAPYDSGKRSRLFLGASAKLAGGGKTATTPFVKSSPDDIKSLYYLIHLEGIKAGNEAIATPQGGTTVQLQTVSPVSFLVDSVYQALKKAVSAAVGGRTATPPEQVKPYFDLCFPKSGVGSGAPDLVLTFQGGAALTVPPSSYLLDVGDDTVCVAMVSSARLNLTEADGMSFLGSLQQENVHFLYDLDKETLSFEPADCGSLS